ncbi:hypothetical protein FPZ12_030795 [Amycolatopsis acidicola]|uniref:Uncharacterized protein n=1 Tax=Amycolatopsis acidicola TaxID=2596893 RepID=A0A5N0USK0_9PSEU|nr:hypothetical protein [Amycolatopsis acidicola]KAA9154921.1 hypothetical protein FPZ12_030795 [Amycolatopsis acidicola]
MDQLSFYSAEANGPELADLAGVLCGRGRIVSFGRTAARLSVTVGEPWRARALVTEFGRRGVQADVSRAEEGLLVRTAFRIDLIRLANAWQCEELPEGFRLTGSALRLWALADGLPAENHYLFAVDEEMPARHEKLAEACTQLGVPARLVGPRHGGPAIRVTGRKRLAALEELLGAPPPAAAAVWPRTAPVKDEVRPEAGSAA